MKKFVFKILLFSTIILSIFCGCIYYLHNAIWQEDLYILAYEKKIALLEQETESPRIILLGGSNLAFGVDSESLEKELGIPVINYGLHAGLGLYLPIKNLDKYLKEGDIVICCPEYDMFFGNGYYGGESTLTNFLLAFPEYLENVNYKQIQVFFRGIKRCSLEIINAQKNDNPVDSTFFSYSMNGFNAYGDEVSHLNCNDKTIPTQIIKSQFCQENLNSFINILDNWANKGIKVIVFPPCCHKQHYIDNKNKIDCVALAISKSFPSFASEISASLFCDDEMFDTIYHLNRKGRERNTKRLLAILSSVS